MAKANKVKQKSHSGAKKRVKVTGKGKVKVGQSHKRHILTKKSTKRKRQLRGRVEVEACHVEGLKQILPHSGIVKQA